MQPVTPWRTSTYSDGLQCVEVRRVGTDVQVRDSKNPDGPVHTFSRGEMAAWIKGVKAGEFDDLA